MWLLQLGLDHLQQLRATTGSNGVAGVGGGWIQDNFTVPTSGISAPALNACSALFLALYTSIPDDASKVSTSPNVEKCSLTFSASAPAGSSSILSLVVHCQYVAND